MPAPASIAMRGERRAALKTVTLERLAHTDEGTLGKLAGGGSFTCFTMEPPWRDNRPNRSCIIEGTYRCV